MNHELIKIVQLYATKSHKELNSYLLDKSKDALISVIVDMLTTYINDKNSSTIRELLTVILAGYEHSGEKIGYNGYMKLAYLHPEYYRPDASKINIPQNQKYFLVRLSNLTAHHDPGKKGIDSLLVERLINYYPNMEW